MKIISFFILLFSAPSFACRPRFDFKAPSFDETYKKSSLVFIGKVLSQKNLGSSSEPFGIKYQIKFQVQKLFKGKKVKTVTLVNYSNTCDTFGTDVAKDDVCFIFANENGKTLSGLFNGYASACSNPLSPDFKKVLDERENAIK